MREEKHDHDVKDPLQNISKRRSRQKLLIETTSCFPMENNQEFFRKAALYKNTEHVMSDIMTFVTLLANRLILQRYEGSPLWLLKTGKKPKASPNVLLRK